MDEGKDLIFTITKEDKEHYKRLDQYLSQKNESLSRNTIKNLFEKGHVTSSLKLELKKLPPEGTEIVVTIPAPKPAKAKAEKIPLSILFEDEHLIIVDKNAGMVVHPAPGNYEGTLVNALLHHCKDLTGVGDVRRPGIVHRLDKGTIGVMVVAKSHACHQGLINLFSTHDIDREYECLCVTSKIAVGGKLDAPIGRHPQNRLKMEANVKNSKNAITYFNVIDHFSHCAHVKCKLETGRTHQIRVHLSSLLRAPILNDSLYGKPSDHKNRLGEEIKKQIGDYQYPFLHARKLGFIHPITQKKLLFETPAPKIFLNVLNFLKKEND